MSYFATSKYVTVNYITDTCIPCSCVTSYVLVSKASCGRSLASIALPPMYGAKCKFEPEHRQSVRAA